MAAITSRRQWMVAALAAAMLFAVAAAMSMTHLPSVKSHADLEALKAQYRRPTTIPVPSNGPMTPERIELGRRLFSEKRLSVNDSTACATCHEPALAFTDGAALGKGVTRQPLARHTPSLWNLAWSRTFFWDGRASSLEEQARFPIEHPKEMGQPLAAGVAKLAADPSYLGDFEKAFPDAQALNETNLLRSLATYERTLVSPPTRFDNWVMGDVAALDDNEVKGLLLFNGKAKCSTCHSGWNFTDYAYHDIGLPGTDLGRGPIIGFSKVDHAFKTPSLRELVWTAPYMHDGSLATLDDVLRHYESGGEARPSRSPDMPDVVALDDSERQSLIAFLETISSDRPPRPLAQISNVTHFETGASSPTLTNTVSQRNKMFAPNAVSIRKGEALTVVNDDTRPHNVRIYDPRLKFDSGVQEPGDKAIIGLSVPGLFEAFCGIHPNMRLTIEVK